MTHRIRHANALPLESVQPIDDIPFMARSIKNGRPKKASHAAKGDEIYGYTREGLPVWKPAFKPKSFTVHELQRAVREVKRRIEQTRSAG